MKIRLFTLAGLLLLSSLLSAQILIDQDDMPNVDDTLRYSATYNLAGIDYTETGQNHVWDFSGIGSFQAQKADTFVHVWSTPPIYQIVFLYPFVSTLASPGADFTLIPGFELTEVYTYFKETSDQFREVGSAFTVNNIPLPFQYDDPDVIYNLPVQFGDIDSCESSFGVTIPGLGHYSRVKKRKNVVDGWGEITTPYGTFQALRMKTEIIQHDSIYVEDLGFGFPIHSETTEYKWLVNGIGRPLLKVVEPGLMPPYIEYISFPEEPLLVDIGPDRHICDGDTAMLNATVTGGTPPYFYLWNTLEFEDTIEVSPGQTSDFWVTVMDSKFNFASDSVTVFVHQPPIADAGADTSIIITTVVQLNGTAQGGYPPYTYWWTPPSGLNDPGIPDPLASPPATTVYTLEVTDTMGCTGSDDVTVNVIQMPTYNISGMVTEPGGEPVEGVEIGFSGLFPAGTGADGSYIKTVHQGWSGTALPVAENYSFDPDSIVYSNVSSDITGQNYIATFIPPPTYTITGVITDEITGVPSVGVTVQVTGESDVVTNDAGVYSAVVTEGWSGHITPVGYEFDPVERYYENVNQDISGQDYIRLQGGLPPGWQFTQTGRWHIHNIPVDADPRVYGVSLAAGDWIGVFFINDNGDESCGGAVEWPATSGINLIAYGDDPATPEKEGFGDLEDVIWRVYTWDNFSEYYAEADYHWFFIDDGKFHNLGFSRLTDLQVTGYALNLHVLLEGPYAGGTMSSSLNVMGAIPLSQPYNQPPWNYNGSEQVPAIPNSRIVDWILLDIRETPGDVTTATSQTSIARMACFLMDDGGVRTLNGAGLPLMEQSINEHLFVVIYHRNHLSIMTKNNLTMKDGSFTCDLRNMDEVLGDQLGSSDLGDGSCAMIAGNGDSNTQVSHTDKNDVWKPQSGSSGYYNGDFNLDGQVDNIDKNDLWAPNCGRGAQVIP